VNDNLASLIRPEIVSLTPYKFQNKPSGAINLDLNENPYPPSPIVIKSLSEEIFHVNRYPNPQMEHELRKELSEYTNLDPENIFISNGSDSIIYALMDVFISKGDKVVTLKPSFKVYEIATMKNGGKMEHYLLREPDFRVNKDELVELAKGSKLLILVNPNNPTGNLVIKKDDIESLLSEYEGLVVVDEAYYEFCNVTFANLINEYHNLVIIRTFSKAFSLAGLRIGYALAHKNIVNLLLKVRQPIPFDKLALKAALMALKDIEYMKKIVKLIINERARLFSHLKSIANITPFPSQTNFILFKSSIADLSKKLAEHKIFIKDFSEALGNYYYRVSIGLPSENKLFIDKLKEIIKEH